jgi:hypothetical protein
MLALVSRKERKRKRSKPEPAVALIKIVSTTRINQQQAPKKCQFHQNCLDQTVVKMMNFPALFFRGVGNIYLNAFQTHLV